MKRLILSAALLLLLTSHVLAQFVWTDRSQQEGLPEGVKLFRGVQESPATIAYLLEVDTKVENIVVHPYYSQTYRTTSNFTGHVGAIAAVNGGFFSTTASVSALVEPGELKAQNLIAVNRDGTIYPISRGFFAINQDRSMSVDWLYHFGSTLADLYKLNQPTPNVPGSPAPSPVRADGSAYEQLLMGIGGGPVLVKNSQVRVTYDQEGFFGGSGLDGNSNRPRTAVGYTSDGRVQMVVVESGIIANGLVASAGITLPNLAQLMINLGSVEAMNLDGGGSSTMAVGSRLISNPNGGTSQRSVPTILAVTWADSLRLPPAPLEEIILDTEMNGVTRTGTAWFQTANIGDSYGGASSASWLAPVGDGSQIMEYRPALKNTKYEVFGWWSASANRAANTPYTITHAAGTTTVFANQQQNNARWVSLGEFTFTGTGNDKVTISNNATAVSGQATTFVVADAVRFVQLEPVSSSTDRSSEMPQRVSLQQNYPNPFNPSTTIRFELPSAQMISLRVFDMAGRQIDSIYSGFLEAGSHQINYNASHLSSGAYMYVLESEGIREQRLMTLIK